MTKSIATALPSGKETHDKTRKTKVSELAASVLQCASDGFLKVQIAPTLALSFRIIKVNVIIESREHSFSQDNMENFTAFIPS